MTRNRRLPHLRVDVRGKVALVGLDRPAKRNAIDDALLASLDAFFAAPPESVRVAVLYATGEHFCAGLDLAEHRERPAEAVIYHSQSWQRAFERIQFGRIPVIAVLKGAVVGGGIELAMAAHVRVAEDSTFYALPEGGHGIFVGGGGSVRIARTIGTGRMVEMMLTGRRYDAGEGLRLGLSHYVTASGEGLAKALELAERIARNAPLSNYAITTALPRIADMASTEGLFAESLMTALTQASGESRRRMGAFLDRKARSAGTGAPRAPARRRSGTSR
jgi:enoyl-CoA hydratase/carnithine racemase